MDRPLYGAAEYVDWAAGNSCADYGHDAECDRVFSGELERGIPVESDDGTVSPDACLDDCRVDEESPQSWAADVVQAVCVELVRRIAGRMDCKACDRAGLVVSFWTDRKMALGQSKRLCCTRAVASTQMALSKGERFGGIGMVSDQPLG